MCDACKCSESFAHANSITSPSNALCATVTSADRLRSIGTSQPSAATGTGRASVSHHSLTVADHCRRPPWTRSGDRAKDVRPMVVPVTYGVINGLDRDSSRERLCTLARVSSRGRAPDNTLVRGLEAPRASCRRDLSASFAPVEPVIVARLSLRTGLTRCQR